MFKETQSLDRLTNIEAQFDNIIRNFEAGISNLDAEVKEFAENNYYEIIDVFLELKQDLKNRLKEVKSKNTEFVLPALDELNKLFGVVVDVLENDFVDYKIKNKFRSFENKEKELVATTISKRTVDVNKKIYNKVEVVFNFKQTEYKQARVKIVFQDVIEQKEYSLRIDRDEEHGGVFFDLDTPNINKIFNGIEDSKGSWHHFRSAALSNEFLESEKFANLVQAFKEILLQTSEKGKFSVQDLIEKYKRQI